MKKFLLVVGVLFLVVVIAAGAGVYVLRQTLYAPGHPDPAREEIVEVPKGTTGQGLGRILAARGFIQDPMHWRIYLLLEGGPTLKAGRFKVQHGMSIPQLVTVFSGAPLPEDEPFTLVEGWRLRDIDAALAAKGWAPAGAYEKAARTPSLFKTRFPLPKDSLEGYLFPQTYAVVPKNFDVTALIARQLDLFSRTFYEPNLVDIARSGRTLHELVTMASLLEREEPDPSKRAMVAGILWKRLSTGMALGVDATSRYELSEWNDRQAFLTKLRDPNCRWNTRLRRGLPPGPIGAPSLASLLAALHPVESEYWFYLHDATGTLRPSRNSAEHERMRARYNVY